MLEIQTLRSKNFGLVGHLRNQPDGCSRSWNFFRTRCAGMLDDDRGKAVAAV
jgi:hypothetical protein